MPRLGKTQKECRFCALLKEEIWGNQRLFRCQKGRFDDKFGTCSFAWSGVWRPNQTVAAAQKDCPYFQVDSQVKLITRKRRG